MPYDEDTKVFDVARPSKAQPDATSRPVIVGHRPQMSDPMVREDITLSAPSTPIHVAMADEEPMVISQPAEAEAPSIGPETPNDFVSHYAATEHEPASTETEPDAEESQPVEATPSFTPLHSLMPEEGEDSEHHDNKEHEEHQPPEHGEGWHEAPPLPITPGAGPKRRWPKIVAVLVVLLVIGGYLAIDSGLVNAGINLPFHVFKQKTKTVATPPPSPAPVTKTLPPTEPTTPAGFTAYKLANTDISFAYPTAWGKPTATAVEGVGNPEGSQETKGVLAYRINFSAAKNMEISTTSSKYAFEIHGTTANQAGYYAFLQWCVGTSDQKFYEGLLGTRLSSGPVTPTTVSCNTGPLKGAVKLDETTLFQSEKDVEKKNFADPTGDYYIKNLNDPEWVVLRVVDGTTKNADSVKTLLTTVKSSSSSSTSTTP